MDDATRNKKFPVLALRLKRREMAYLRREAGERHLSLPEYVRKVLIPFDLPGDNKSVDTL